MHRVMLQETKQGTTQRCCLRDTNTGERSDVRNPLPGMRYLVVANGWVTHSVVHARGEAKGAAKNGPSWMRP